MIRYVKSYLEFVFEASGHERGPTEAGPSVVIAKERVDRRYAGGL